MRTASKLLRGESLPQHRIASRLRSSLRKWGSGSERMMALLVEGARVTLTLIQTRIWVMILRSPRKNQSYNLVRKETIHVSNQPPKKIKGRRLRMRPSQMKRMMRLMIVSQAKTMQTWVTMSLARLSLFWTISFQKPFNWNLQFLRLKTITLKSTLLWRTRLRNRRWSMVKPLKSPLCYPISPTTYSSLIWSTRYFLIS